MTEYEQDNDREIPLSSSDTGTTRATGMGNPGEFRTDTVSVEERGPIDHARAAAGGKLEETARKVRELGDRAAQKNRALERARPMANNAADNIDHAARYVRDRELDEMRSDFEEQVRRHPLASVAMAFLAGYTLRRMF